MKVQNSKKTIMLIVVLALVLVPMLTVMNGCEPKTTETSAPAATATPTATPAGGPYQGVVLVGGVINLLSPFGFDSAKGTIAENGFWWSWNCWMDDNTENRRGARYFTLDLTEEQIYDRSAYDAQTAAGNIPYIYGAAAWANMDAAPYGRAKNLPVDQGEPYWPDVVTKVYFDMWVWDFPDKPGDGINAKWVYQYVQRDLQDNIDRVRSQSPNAEVYIGGVYPFAKTFPRFGAENWPENKYNWIDPSWVTGEKPEKWQSASNQLKAFCEENGYHFVDYNVPAFATDEGYAKEEYMTERCHGGLLSAAGAWVYGDILMEAMGLPKATHVS